MSSVAASGQRRLSLMPSTSTGTATVTIKLLPLSKYWLPAFPICAVAVWCCAVCQVLVQQPDVFVKAGTAFFPGSSLTGNGLLVSDGEVWKKQRRLSNPAFRKAAVDRCVGKEGKGAQIGVQESM